MTPHPSAPGTQVNGEGPPILDANGTKWRLNSVGQIVMFPYASYGKVIPTERIVTLFWTGSQLLCLNFAGEWWDQPLDGGTATKATAPEGYVAAKEGAA